MLATSAVSRTLRRMGGSTNDCRTDIDPFCTAFFDCPYPAHAAMRDAGSVVFLPRHDIHAVARYDDVRSMLTDWGSFSTARGVGIFDFPKEKPWRLNLLLEADPPLHGRPTLARAAFEEAARLESPAQTFFCTAMRDAMICDETTMESCKLVIFLGAANRDPRRWERSDEYERQSSWIPEGAVGYRLQ